MKYLSLILSILLLWACTDNSGTETEQKKDSAKLTLSVNKQNILVNNNDSIIMYVSDEYNKDWTTSAIFYVDNVELDGNVFKTQDIGTYTLSARLEAYELTSNTVTVEASVAKSLSIITDKTEAINDGIDKIVIVVKDEDGNDITQSVSLYANDEKLTDIYVSSTKSGQMTLRAKYEDLEATTYVNFNADAKLIKRLLIEDYTGTWCSQCPKAATAIKDVKNQYSHIIPVGIHRGSNEPMQNRFSIALADYFNPEGIYPTVYMDRNEIWKYPYSTDISHLLEGNAALGLAISTDNSGGNVEVSVTVRFAESSRKNLKLTVYIVEDGLIYKQYGAPDPDNYVHDHVLRQCLTDIFGDVIPQNEININNNYSQTFISTLDAEYKADNCKVVAFVSNVETQYVLNVQEVDLGMKSGY